MSQPFMGSLLNVSCDFLSAWGDRWTVNRSMRVGGGIGPATSAALARFHEIVVGLVDDPMVVGFQTNANALTCHNKERVRCRIALSACGLGFGQIQNRCGDSGRDLLKPKRFH